MKDIIILLCLSSFFKLFAQNTSSNGNTVGNGGDVVVCKDSIEVLDLSEAKMLHTQTIRKLEDKATYKERISELLLSIRTLDPKLYEQYQMVLSQLDKRLKFISKAKFRDVLDSLEIAVGEECELKQIAIQQNLKGQSVIHVDEELWQKLNQENQAALILHEMIYEHFLYLGEKNSIKVRKFNALIHSEEILKMKLEHYQKFARDLGLKFY
jgi:hypothetical protein